MLTRWGRVPDDHKDRVFEVVDYLDGKMKVKSQWLKYLFDVYNVYMVVNDWEEEDYECGQCRSKVYYKFKVLIDDLREEDGV